MKKYHIHPNARQDLKSIRRYTIQNHGVTQSRYYNQKIISSFETICEYPKSGREIDGISKTIRRYDMDKHIIFYDIGKDVVTIIRILHRAVDFLQALE